MSEQKPWYQKGLRGENLACLKQGMRDGIPIMLGYFAVSFALGIAARSIGLSALQATLASFLNNASAGQYAGFTVIAAGGSFLEIAAIELVANARYMLMSCALSQKLDPAVPLGYRLLMGYMVTDEIFGVCIAREGKLNAYYNYGAMISALPGWSLGTCLGVMMGNILPAVVVSSLSVALFGMFLWIIIPQGRKNPVVAAVIAVSFAASRFFRNAAVFGQISDGLKTIILTVVIAAAAALLFPVHTDDAGNLLTGEDEHGA